MVEREIRDIFPGTNKCGAESINIPFRTIKDGVVGD
jgi:hypothetical protein